MPQPVKLLPTTLVSTWAQARLQLHFWSSLMLTHPGEQQQNLQYLGQYLGRCHSCRRLGYSSRLLALTGPSPAVQPLGKWFGRFKISFCCSNSCHSNNCLKINTTLNEHKLWNYCEKIHIRKKETVELLFPQLFHTGQSPRINSPNKTKSSSPSKQLWHLKVISTTVYFITPAKYCCIILNIINFVKH